MNFARYPFFFVNFIFMIFGIFIMSLGILLLTNYSVLEQILQTNGESRSSNFSESVYRSDIPVLLQPSPAPRWLARIRDPASYLMIAFGAAYFTLSFIGYCGNVKDSRRIMIIYAVLLGLIVGLQITGIVLYLKYKPNLKAEMATAINTKYKPEEMKKFTQFEFILDLLMINYKCCGVNSEKDFKEAYSHFYSVRSLPIDPRNSGRANTKSPYYSVTVSSSLLKEEDTSPYGETETKDKGIATTLHEDDTTTPENSENLESRIVTGQTEPSVRQVPVSCCKLNITNVDAAKMLRNIYRKQDDKLQLLDFALDENCVTNPDETNAYVGESHGCFDKIQGQIATPLRIGVIIVGLFQLCGLVFAIFIFKAAYYDWPKK